MTIHDAMRRQLLKASVAGTAGITLGSSFIARQAFAKDFPSRTINALIPFSPGGGTDRSVRVLTPAWEAALGGSARFRPNNQPGAGTLIAQNTLKNSRHDAHTLLFTPLPHTAWLSVLEPETFQMDQIAWIGSYFQDPNVLLVAKDSPYKTAQDLIDDAKKTGKVLTASVSSPMSAAHAATVVFRERAGINLRVVPFSGGAEARNAVAGGHVDCCMAPYWSAINVLELTRALCIFAPKDPSSGLWDAPPANEVLKFEMPDLNEPYGVHMSKKASEDHPERQKLLVDTFQQAMRSDEFKNAAQKQDLAFFSEAWGPDQCQKFCDDYLALLKQYRPAMEADVKSM
ncbi:Bug family tripartite tricarboxylate transporter substrate binding protein [Allopusillimonas ginsengisoli]|uniref:Bug family tripartite tricarboxylate transporter substrate binding protein n=1 Tax=Allopusillimonas ginsengisoli TaxID=453575 RepID=UPI0010C20CBD|nr:tripartite tricarboxylate transporter substrate binding protein [Allopusillimonas ginsengisoli]